MEDRRFDWDRDCGSGLSPSEAARLCKEQGISSREFAEDYAANHFPKLFPGERPPINLVIGMTIAIEEVLQRKRSQRIRNRLRGSGLY